MSNVKKRYGPDPRQDPARIAHLVMECGWPVDEIARPLHPDHPERLGIHRATVYHHLGKLQAWAEYQAVGGGRAIENRRRAAARAAAQA